jgi:uncharacterized repeat protein (TIGR03803 family)
LGVLFAPAPALVPVAWTAPKYNVLHAFTGGKDGGGLYGGLVLDAAGNVYGTTTLGTVFELTPHSNNKWGLEVVHRFDGSDGSDPMSTATMDSSGNLYGTTVFGGAHGYGTVFELSPGTGGWKETILHSFGFNKHGCCPWAGVTMDSAGKLYGTASVAFELSPGSEGWKEIVLHTFSDQGNDGYEPYAGLIRDAIGSLYGTTQHGGGSKNCDGGCGTVYQLAPATDGKWKEHILHRFGSSGDGAFPGVGALVLDSAGNVYGTTQIGGPAGYGIVFKLARTANGGWKETILHSFADDSNGGYVAAGVVFDPAGNLYGTTGGGGDPNCGCGVVYELSPASDGKWTYKLLHTFIGSDGAGPGANLIRDDKGNLYGTTVTGGSGGSGVAFELTP